MADLPIKNALWCEGKDILMQRGTDTVAKAVAAVSVLQWMDEAFALLRQ